MAGRKRKDTELLADAGLALSVRQATDGQPQYLISGNTHAHRRALKTAGGTWDKLGRAWKFTGEDPSPAIVRALHDALAADGANGKAATTGLAEPGDNKPHYLGHRQRLRQRFMEAGPDALPDYELLELLLFYGIPRIDVKPLAKALIERFGSFSAVFAAEPERLAEFDKLTYNAIVGLKAVHAATLRLTREDLGREENVLSSWSKLIKYLKAGLADSPKERFQVVFLNSRNAIIADEVQQEGTVNHTPVYPREVIKRALELGATALIMVHNHPSGDPSPSAADIAMTTEVAEAAEKLGIVLHDHVIISKSGHTSFKEMGLL